jgi:aprataxin
MPRTKMTRPSSRSALGSKTKAKGDNSVPPSKRQKPSQKSWADGLYRYLEDPSDPAVVYADEDIIAIKDQYPKAKCHYLVMPRDERLRSASDLRLADLPLLRRMEQVGNKLVHDNNENGDPSLEYRMGFHAVPSMHHLHMHVISQDFDSSCFRNKKHWNSFTTTFFIPIEEMKAGVEKGDVDFSYREHRLKDGLKCHRCGKAQSSIPQLKLHIEDCDCDPFRRS